LRPVVAIAAMAVVVFDAPAIAQSPTPSAPACELHVWPSTELKSVTEGALFNDRVNQAFDPAHGGVERPNVLGPERQLEIMANADLPKLLGIGQASIVPHAEPLPRSIAAEKIRHSTSAAACYAELLVGQIIYEKNTLAGASLRLLGIFRTFGADGQPMTSFMTWASRPLLQFPAKKPEDAKAAQVEIDEAYRASLIEFAGFATKPPKKK
jgi:hypothetical protein